MDEQPSILFRVSLFAQLNEEVINISKHGCLLYMLTVLPVLSVGKKTDSKGKREGKKMGRGKWNRRKREKAREENNFQEVSE